MSEQLVDPGLVEFWQAGDSQATLMPYNVWVLVHYWADGKHWSASGRVTKRRHRDTPTMPAPHQVYLRVVSGGLILVPRGVVTVDLVNMNQVNRMEELCPAKLTQADKDERQRLLDLLARERSLHGFVNSH